MCVGAQGGQPVLIDRGIGVASPGVDRGWLRGDDAARVAASLRVSNHRSHHHASNPTDAAGSVLQSDEGAVPTPSRTAQLSRRTRRTSEGSASSSPRKGKRRRRDASAATDPSNSSCDAHETGGIDAVSRMERSDDAGDRGDPEAHGADSDQLEETAEAIHTLLDAEEVTVVDVFFVGVPRIAPSDRAATALLCACERLRHHHTAVFSCRSRSRRSQRGDGSRPPDADGDDDDDDDDADHDESATERARQWREVLGCGESESHDERATVEAASWRGIVMHTAPRRDETSCGTGNSQEISDRARGKRPRGSSDTSHMPTAEAMPLTEHAHSCVTLTPWPEPRVSSLDLRTHSLGRAGGGGSGGGGAVDVQVPVAIELLRECASADVAAVLRHPHRYRVGSTMNAPASTREMLQALAGGCDGGRDAAAVQESSTTILARVLFHDSRASSRPNRDAWMKSGSEGVTAGPSCPTREMLRGHQSGDVLVLLTPSRLSDGSRFVMAEILRGESYWPEMCVHFIAADFVSHIHLYFTACCSRTCILD